MSIREQLAPSAWTLGGFAAGSTVLFSITCLLVGRSGLSINLPWGLLTALAVIALPFAIVQHRISLANWERLPEALRWVGALVCAGVVLRFWQNPVLWIGLVAALAILPATRPRVSHGRRLLYAMAILICCYGVVWNLNYLMMRYLASQRWDPLLRDMDITFYSLFSGPMPSLTGYFPLVRDQFWLRIFDNAYTILNPQILTVAYVLVQERDERTVVRFFQRLFSFYLAGILIYAAFPVNGPHLAFPEQQVLSLLPPSTAALCEGMMHDFQVAKTGGQLMGFGYFIGLPSLHVLMALFLQHTMVPFRGLFRVFLPINIFLCLSTVVLGYHYVFDAVGAALVYAVAMVWQAKRMPRGFEVAPAWRIASF